MLLPMIAQTHIRFQKFEYARSRPQVFLGLGFWGEVLRNDQDVKIARSEGDKSQYLSA